MEPRRVISEPTAAALAYGLHKKKGVEHIVVVDLGQLYNHTQLNSIISTGLRGNRSLHVSSLG